MPNIVKAFYNQFNLLQCKEKEALNCVTAEVYFQGAHYIPSLSPTHLK